MGFQKFHFNKKRGEKIMERVPIINVPEARIIFRNFRGEERTYNNKGDRNFNLVLNEEEADRFTEMGFRVRARAPRAEDADTQYLLPVAVSFKNRPPKAVLIGSKNKTVLTEDTIGELDYAEIENVDLSIRPYYWSMPNGTSGVKAYLNSIYVTILEDDFEDKYRDFPEH